MLDHSKFSEEDRTATRDLIDHLLGLYDAGTLAAPFLKLALEPLQDAEEIAQIVGPLVRFAAHQSQAMGHREFQRSDALPWIASSYSALEARTPLEGFQWVEAPKG
jgi:hypothetical protein